MSDVFPTLWSPRSTILLRFSGGDEKSGVAGVVELDIAWRESSSCDHFCCSGSASGGATTRDHCALNERIDLARSEERKGRSRFIQPSILTFEHPTEH